ncbi:glycerophosphodiester phosphodiesterase family protein [Rugamonas sp.]|uniref:glycerophosphodiester phosphodiesterase family protein n=1 Tax=Rugamonas sp. TaxID=1926287 RepID=UPI0025EB3ECF|nr:glycerophosphodiester phosphodiesterase family protein [Rugamonas sp.]
MTQLILPGRLSRRGFIQSAALAAGAALIVPGAAFGAGAPAGAAGAVRPTLLGHRGCSAQRPEHTLASFGKAIADGADYVEPDLVCTKDGVLVARHEANLTETTDVASRPEFAGRRVTKTIDYETKSGWYIDDFTLAELKTLRAVERIPKVRPASARYDGMFQVATWEEIIDFVAAEAATHGRIVGLVPELKHSTYFASVGLPLEDRFLAVTGSHEYTRSNPVEIQSFETANLKYLRNKLGHRANLRLMQLVVNEPVRPSDVVAAGGKLTFADMCKPEGLRDIATYADVVAPPHRVVIPVDKDGKLMAPSALVGDAHQAGLRVETWTFRPENQFLAADFRNDAGPNVRNEAGSIAEMKRYIAAGLDGFFTDDPGLGRQAIGS